MKLTTRQVGDVTVVDAVGRITLGEGASTFRDSVRETAENEGVSGWAANRDDGTVGPGHPA